MEDRIMELVYNGYTYEQIQKKLGCPSKAYIKKVIKDKNPELYAIIGNSKKLNEFREEQWAKFLEKDGE
jgi:transposase